MSDTNRVGLRFFRSSQRTAPIPGGPFNLNQLRFTGTPNLAFTPNTIVSNEIRPDRQIADLILVGAEAGGDTGIELSFEAFDALIEDALFSTFVSTIQKLGTGEITGFAAGVISVDDGTDFIVGQIIRLQKLLTGDVGDGIFEITGIAVNDLTVNPLAGTATTAIVGTETADADTRPNVTGFAAQANGDITFTVTGNDTVVQFPAGALDNALGNGIPITIGAWFKFADFATVKNNVWARAREVDLTADTITLDTQTGMATDAAMDSRNRFITSPSNDPNLTPPNSYDDGHGRSIVNAGGCVDHPARIECYQPVEKQSSSMWHRLATGAGR